MGATQRKWFYLCCLVAWVVVGVLPASKQVRAEQAVLDAEFYSNIPTITEDELVKRAESFREQAGNVTNWAEYNSALKTMFESEMHLHRLHKGAFFTNGDFRKIMLSESMISSASNHLIAKAHEMTTARLEGRTPVPQGEGREAYQPKSASMVPYWLSIWTSWMFAFLVLLVRVDAAKQSILLELATPWWLALATIFWPVGLFKYPNSDPARQMVRALRFVTAALGVGLGLAPASAMAQAKKVDKDGKKSSPFTLTFDARNTLVMGPDPNPDSMLKTTLTTPGGRIFQSTNTYRKDGVWSVQALFGKKLLARNGASLSVLSGGSKNSTGNTTLTGALSGGIVKARWLSVFPIAGFDHNKTRNTNSVYAVNVTGLRFGKWTAGVESFVLKTLGRPSYWYTGGFVSRSVSRSAYAEVTTYRDRFGTWRIRGRTTYSFSW